MKTIYREDEDNRVIVDDEYGSTTYTVDPTAHTFSIWHSVKDDAYFIEQLYEYKVSTNPIELSIRMIESKSEPPEEWEVKDGVVLEADILKDKKKFALFGGVKKKIEELKKAVEWQKVNILWQYAPNLFILSKETSVISSIEFRKFVRQSAEKLKSAISKIEDAVKKDTTGLQIIEDEYGKSIWYPAEMLTPVENRFDMPDDEFAKTDLGKKEAHAIKFSEDLFNSSSPNWVGISKTEFDTSTQLLQYLEELLAGKASTTRESNDAEMTPKRKLMSWKWWIVVILSIVALVGGIWTAIGVFILGAIFVSLLSK